MKSNIWVQTFFSFLCFYLEHEKKLNGNVNKEWNRIQSIKSLTGKNPARNKCLISTWNILYSLLSKWIENFMDFQSACLCLCCKWVFPRDWFQRFAILQSHQLYRSIRSINPFNREVKRKVDSFFKYLFHCCHLKFDLPGSQQGKTFELCCYFLYIQLTLMYCCNITHLKRWNSIRSVEGPYQSQWMTKKWL